VTYFALPRPRVFGHRGAAGVAPENTVPSFALAAALGAPYLELDVHGTRDGTIVVTHDATLERTTNGEGPVREWTWAELERLDAGWRFTYDGAHFPYRGQGVRIPTLESILRQFPAACFNIEVKQTAPDIVAEVVTILERTGTTSRVLLAAEQDDIMARIRAVTGGRAATGFSVGDVVGFVARVAAEDWSAYEPPGRALQIPPAYDGVDLVSAASVAAAHRQGIEVHVWTINDRDEIRRLLALGVDGIMSDLPGLAVETVRPLRDGRP
jgi:glycerophosphoryl diester phosphodiesterase